MVLYGTILAAATYLVVGLTPIDLYQLAQSTTGLASILCWFMVASLPAIPLVAILESIVSRVLRKSMHMSATPKKGDDDYLPPFYTFCNRLEKCFTKPLRGLHSLKHIFSKMEKLSFGEIIAKLQSIISFLWAVSFVAFIILAFAELRQVTLS